MDTAETAVRLMTHEYCWTRNFDHGTELLSSHPFHDPLMMNNPQRSLEQILWLPFLHLIFMHAEQFTAPEWQSFPPTSQSNSRCSCPSIHSSISSLLCRSLRLYFTVSLPSLRCAGSSVLSGAWNITLDWVSGSDAMATTASGEPGITQTEPLAVTHSTRSSYCDGLLSHSLLPLFIYLLNAGSNSLPVLVVPLVHSLWSLLSCSLSLHLLLLQHPLAALSGGW